VENRLAVGWLAKITVLEATTSFVSCRAKPSEDGKAAVKPLVKLVAAITMALDAGAHAQTASPATCNSPWHHAGAVDEREAWQFGKLLRPGRVCGWYQGRGCTAWGRSLCRMHFQTSGYLPALRNLIHPADLWKAVTQ
jgi:hypothetical protein